jgi:2-polyprenyl-3-methyl-5-hydroxy-6-metoxy-1,4-benzoquinol methylase
MRESHHIRTEPRPACPLCGAEGEYLYRDLEDRLFGVPGHWSIRQCANRACGLLWLDPIPAPHDLVKLYARYHTHTVGSTPSSAWSWLVEHVYEGYWYRRYGYLAGDKGWLDQMLGCLIYLHPKHRTLADVRVMHLPVQVGGKLLDIGCGNGATLACLQKLGWDVEGVEFDPTAGELARRRGLKIHLGTLEAQRFPDNSYDAVVSNHVLEHVPDPKGLLQECYRILKPEGQLVCDTPNAGSYGHQRFRSHWRGLEPPRHLHLFTADSLRYVAAMAGFQHIRCHSTGRGGYALFASHMLKKHGAFHANNLSYWNKLERLMCHYAEWLVVTINGQLGEVISLRATK